MVSAEPAVLMVVVMRLAELATPPTVFCARLLAPRCSPFFSSDRSDVSAARTRPSNGSATASLAPSTFFQGKQKN